MISTFLFITGIGLLGFLILNFISKGKEPLQNINLGFLIGSGIHTLIVFYLNWLGLNMDSRTLYSSLLVSIVFIFAIGKFAHVSVPFLRLKNEVLSILREVCSTKKNLILFFTIMYFFFSSMLANVYWPVRDWDALTLYDFRAKIFADSGSISEVFKIHRYYLAYPLYTSLMHSFIYIVGNNSPLIIYTLIYIMFVFSFILVVRKRTSITYALFVGSIVSFTPQIFEHSKIAYTNFPYAAFLIIGYLYLMRWVEKQDLWLLCLSCLFVALSTWIRSSEPFWITPLVAILLFAKKSKMRLFLMYLFGIFLVKIGWGYYASIQAARFPVKSSLDLSLLSGVTVNFLASRFFEVVIYFWNYVIKPQFFILSTYFVTFAIFLRHKNPMFVLQFFLITFNIILIFSGTFIVSLIYPKWYLIGDSVSRMSLFLIPLVIYSMADMLYRTNLISWFKK